MIDVRSRHLSIVNDVVVVVGGKNPVTHTRAISVDLLTEEEFPAVESIDELNGERAHRVSRHVHACINCRTSEELERINLFVKDTRISFSESTLRNTPLLRFLFFFRLFYFQIISRTRQERRQVIIISARPHCLVQKTQHARFTVRQTKQTNKHTRTHAPMYRRTRKRRRRKIILQSIVQLVPFVHPTF